jgi:Fe/S biogenesis protein NfuA
MNFKDAGILSKEFPDFNVQDYILDSQTFFEKRREASLHNKVYVFDLRSFEDYETSHLPGAHHILYSDFEDSIYQMPFAGEIMLYGYGKKELFSAAEILFDNGFENFYIWKNSYADLLKGVDNSFFNISLDARGYLLKEKIELLHLIIEIKTDSKANYSIALPNPKDYPLDTISIDFSKWGIVVAKEAIPYLEGTEIRMNEEGDAIEAFNPSMSLKELSGSVEERIQFVLDEEVNPMVAEHGGSVSLLEIKDQNLYLEFGGSCVGCGMVDVTLKQGIEEMFKTQVPEIEAIYDITDHADGTNPYYQASEK